MPGKRAQGHSQPQWPTVEEQLAAANVVHGTALEQLVRENQDFSLLRREEIADGLRLPPWLRVDRRKQHPEIETSPGDPDGRVPACSARHSTCGSSTHQGPAG